MYKGTYKESPAFYLSIIVFIENIN